MRGLRVGLRLAAGAALVAAAALVSAPLVAAQEAAAGTDPAKVIGAPRGTPLAGEALTVRTEDVAGVLRCPVCQGLSVADSPASMAVSMKAQVKDLLAQGYDQEQILAYFENSYGEFVRLEPPLRGVNWLVWLGPVIALAAGLAFVFWTLRARRRAAVEDPSPLPGPGTLPDDPELARQVRRVRELAYGWPDGRPPGSSD